MCQLYLYKGKKKGKLLLAAVWKMDGYLLPQDWRQGSQLAADVDSK